VPQAAALFHPAIVPQLAALSAKDVDIHGKNGSFASDFVQKAPFPLSHTLFTSN